MLLLFFVVWIIFNGRITMEILLLGVAVAGCMFWFVCKFMDYSIQKERTLYRILPDLVRYVWVLVKEIILANWSMCRFILTRKEVVEPVIVHVHTNLRTEMAKVILANSITLTPGTISVSLTDQKILVHCLDKSLAEGMEDSVLVKMLERIEEKVG